MAHDTGGPEDVSSSEEEEFVDIDEELEPGAEREGLTTRVRQKLGNTKDKYFDWHTVEQPKQDQGVAGTNISRRGFVSGAAQLGVLGFAFTEATDGDGWNVDWSPGEPTDGAPAGGGAPPPADQDGNGAATTTEQQYAFETEEELIDSTGLCYPTEAGAYIGAIDATEVENTLDESGYMGDDPSGALSAEEVSMGLDDITAHQGLYAVDVDRKQGNDGDYDMFVQLVGQEDGGLYVTKEGAQQIGDMEFEETFEGYQECN
jgi:hypothetical protein